MGTDELMLFLKIPLFYFSFLYSKDVSNKTIIPPTLAGYRMIIANSYPN